MLFFLIRTVDASSKLCQVVKENLVEIAAALTNISPSDVDFVVHEVKDLSEEYAKTLSGHIAIVHVTNFSTKRPHMGQFASELQLVLKREAPGSTFDIESVTFVLETRVITC